MTTCVGFGTGRILISLEAFLETGSAKLRYLLARSLVVVPSPWRVDLPARQLLHLNPNPVRGFNLSHLSLRHSGYGYGHIDPFAIDYALRPRLRTRLTQGRRPLPWKPWSIGVEDSHLHLVTHTGILTSLRSSTPYGIPSPPKERSPTTHTSMNP